MWEKTMMSRKRAREKYFNLAYNGEEQGYGYWDIEGLLKAQAKITGDIARQQTAQEIFLEIEKGFASYAPEGDIISLYIGGEYWPILKAKWGVK